MDTPPLHRTVRALDTDYRLTLYRPAGRGPFPLVLATDGDDLLAPLVGAARALVAAQLIPPLILAGLGYGGGFRTPVNRRGRDYTPTALPGEPMENGRADAFLGFLGAQLLPTLQAELPVDPAAIGLAGHSLGSLFGLYALFQPAPRFTHFLLSSPSIWWDDRSILRQAAALRARQPRLPARVYLSVGDADTPSMTGDLALLETQLGAPPWAGFDYTVERLAGRDHYNVVPDAYRAGLAWLFGR